MNAHKFDTMTGGNGPRSDAPLLAILLGVALLSMGVM